MFYRVQQLIEAISAILLFVWNLGVTILNLPRIAWGLLKAIGAKRSLKDGWHYFLEENIKAGLARAYEQSEKIRTLNPFELENDPTKYVIFSDQHRGARNGADDFERSERAYNAALAYYYEMGYTLIVLGDVEELWEERPKNVVKAYPHSLSLEAKFHNVRRYHRVYGNHDDIWNNERAVQKHLQPDFDPRPLAVQEGLKIPVVQNGQPIGEFFLVHGHQGSIESDYLTLLSRLFVRFIWKYVQRLTKKRLNTPATHWQLRKLTNIAMYHWAARQKSLVLITGHTHKPVFEPREHELRVRERLDELGSQNPVQSAELLAELEWVRTLGAKIPVEELKDGQQVKYCFFNSGCASYADGDITGLEIANGRIQLVRWPDDGNRPLPKRLDEAPLLEIFKSVNPDLAKRNLNNAPKRQKAASNGHPVPV